MKSLAVVFPGQGAQYAGMGKELAANYQAAREIFDRADGIMNYALSQICFNGPNDMLNRTEITQPAIFTTSMAIWSVLKNEGIFPVMAAGLSLGEYSALTAAGVFDFESALKLVAARGKIMQEAVPEGQGMMAAVLGLEAKVVEDVCKQASDFGVVSVANYNCPGQVVISGSKEAVLKACGILKAEGHRTVPLAVSVPSHCNLMLGSGELLRQELDKLTINSYDFPIISNVTAGPVDIKDVKDILVRQLYSPVKWQQSIEYMADRVDYFVEVGPGKVLSGFIKKMAKEKLLGSVEDGKSLTHIINVLKES